MSDTVTDYSAQQLKSAVSMTIPENWYNHGKSETVKFHCFLQSKELRNWHCQDYCVHPEITDGKR
jgi:hypothetical protein